MATFVGFVVWLFNLGKKIGVAQHDLNAVKQQQRKIADEVDKVYGRIDELMTRHAETNTKLSELIGEVRGLIRQVTDRKIEG